MLEKAGNKISQITMLKHVVKRWKSISLKTKAPTPPGFLAVYVGSERTRFLIPARFLNFPIFAALLEKAEEEYGFKFSGGIAIPCEVGFFEKVLELLEKDEKRYGKLEVNEFLNKISDSFGNSSVSCKEEEGNLSGRHGFIRLRAQES